MTRKNVILVYLLLLISRGLLGAGESTKTATRIYDDMLESVVTLHTRGAAGDGWVATGFVVADSGLIATAWHVVEGATEIIADFADGTTLSVPPSVVATDPTHDLALLALERPYGEPVNLVIEPARVASRVYVVGSPRGYSFSIVDGLVSQLQQVDGYAQYQVSCPISPGNSGAPLIDETGGVIGLVSWSKRNAQNLNFAIPAVHVLALLDSTKARPADEKQEVQVAAADPEKKQVRSETRDSADEFARLLSVLSGNAGKTAVIQLSVDAHSETFRIVIPPGGLASTEPENEKAGP